MTHKITVDVTRAVQDFYPGLSTAQIDYMAEIITNRFDYSEIYDTIHDEIQGIADRKGIELEGKDGVEVIEDKTLLGTADGAFYYKNGDNVVELFEPHIDPYGGH